ncbi:TIGR02234 family membrane protein [Mycobacterium koreense]|uniref:Uncharacterized protein n=1 Tax=Mycolicibacillus koreensis TaxID=1069220 RepID=A0A7I7SAC9_9MYCO|nr:TIGR02234 family membrane protein [Mycolicibacillus koreensis]MCV7248837.1 TIGR02234 family membrane protein [Mycolicibacillus koreensis]ODR08352.1 hypothetical protein BHQ15_09295 [Mycolicibacillus koreensis]OSC36124.1 hypothetical protein B8W67_00715 [Mycolicibacillus koreensis]BBY53683.1 hypothetical protein MKOR_09340 [Mycolicibacillus koreensis]
MAEPPARRHTQMPLRIAQLLLLVGAGGLWAASRLPWVTIHSADGLGLPTSTTVDGATWSSGLVALAVVLVAASVATVAVRGWPLRLLALLVAGASLATGYLAVGQWAGGDVAARAAELADIPVQSLTSGTERHFTGAAVALAVAVATLVAAALLMRAATHRDATAKYVAPGTRRSQAQATGSAGDVAKMSERMIWDALDEGRDPTDAEGRGEGR